MSIHGGSPVRIVEVVANALNRPVPQQMTRIISSFSISQCFFNDWLLNDKKLKLSPLHLTLGCHEEGWAVLLNEGLGRVDQRQSVGNRILGQSVLLCQVSAKQPSSQCWPTSASISKYLIRTLFDSSVSAIWRRQEYCESGLFKVWCKSGKHKLCYIDWIATPIMVINSSKIGFGVVTC